VKYLDESGDFIFTETEQINIPRSTMGHTTPQRKEHGTLEYKLVPIIRASQSVQESFQYETSENELKVFSLFPCNIKKTLANRCSNIR
jgi:nucleoside diphosphate kinase